MKASYALVVSILVSGAVPAAEPSRIRPLDPLAVQAYDHGQRQSATFRALVAELQASDLIVHVVSKWDLPSRIAGATRFVADRGTARYVRIELAASLTSTSRVCVLAHELQHAREIARSGARTTGAVLAFYRARGKRAPTIEDGWETTAAEAAERSVRGELSARAVGARTIE